MSALVSEARGARTSGTTPRAIRRGQVLGDTYRLLERIGSGGMAEVYAAEHTRLNRHFAVKVLRADGPSRGTERFHREVRAIARIENEYVVNVIDCGEADDGTPYLVMDRLRGEDLRSLLDCSGLLPIPRAVSLIWEACQGIAAAHKAGLIHRDLKPANLFVARRSTGEDWCKVLDFGVAKLDATIWTTEGAVIGTVGYMAPEQLRDGASVGPAVDIYALGAILYECLSGAAPYPSTCVHELMFKIMNEAPPPLDERHRQIPMGLQAAMWRALAKSPTERFETVLDFARAIEPFRSAQARAEITDGATTLTLEPAENPAPRARIPTTLAFFVGGLLLGLSALVVRDAVGRGGAPRVPLPARASAAVVQQLDPPLSTAQASVPPPQPPVVPSAGSTAASSPKRKLPASRPTSPPLSLPNARFDPTNPYLH